MTYTHQTHISYEAGRCFLQWNGPRGEVRAEGPNGEFKVWKAEDNEAGLAIGAAMKWCREGCKTESAPDPRTQSQTPSKVESKDPAKRASPQSVQESRPAKRPKTKGD